MSINYPDTTPDPEKETGSKLNRLNPEDLILESLRRMPGIKGDIKIIARRKEGHVECVITDEEKNTLRQIGNSFTYFDEETLEEYPELKTVDNQYTRLLVYVSLGEMTPDILFGEMFEINQELRCKGMGAAFLENLAMVAKRIGYRFLVSFHNDAEVARFFLKRDHYLLEEIKDELQVEFQALKAEGLEETVFYTVRFLNTNDIEYYIKPERIDTSVDDKIEYKRKLFSHTH